MNRITLYAFIILVSFLSCKKDPEAPANPFDDPSLKAPDPPINSYNPATTSFEYLYHNVLKPTCANSNCHDGSFEPDYRSIGSAYNTLVYCVPNQTLTGFPYRVFPGDANKSMIKYRLTQFPGKGIVMGVQTFGQGRMPFIDTNFMYSPSGSAYIQNIIDWINAGAKDIFGNSPTLGNKNPNTFGLQITNTGSSTAKSRQKYFEISKSNPAVDFWIYVEDDNTPAANMVSAELRFSNNRYNFAAATSTTMPLTYEANGNNYMEITNTNNVQYNYKLTGINLAPMVNDTGYIFLRTYIKDTDHSTPSETPNNGTVYYSDYFVIHITP